MKAASSLRKCSRHRSFVFPGNAEGKRQQGKRRRHNRPHHDWLPWIPSCRVSVSKRTTLLLFFRRPNIHPCSPKLACSTAHTRPVLAAGRLLFVEKAVRSWQPSPGEGVVNWERLRQMGVLSDVVKLGCFGPSGHSYTVQQVVLCGRGAQEGRGRGL